MKRGIVLIFLVSAILINSISISAIKINEVELNPVGEDSGNEWVELYSPEEVDLGGWKLINGDGGEFLLNGSFKDFYTISFSSQWLDNKDERVYLYSQEGLIDKTDLIADSSNNDKTWQICDSGSGDEWVFAISTKNQENNCPEEQDEEPPAEENEDNNESIENEKNNTNNDNKEDEEKEEQAEENEVVNLTSSHESSEQEAKVESLAEEQGEKIIRLGKRTESVTSATEKPKVLYRSAYEKMKDYSIYIFAFMLIIIIVLLIKRRREY